MSVPSGIVNCRSDHGGDDDNDHAVVTAGHRRGRTDLVVDAARRARPAPALSATVVIGVILATTLSLRYTDGERPRWARALTVLGAVVALAWIAAQNAGLDGLLEALRGPMPDLLMLLVVFHGAEIADRRTNRVHLAITGVVAAYAVGLRLDGAVGWWMIAWTVAAVVAICTTDRTTRSTGAPRNAARITAWSIAGLVATLTLAALVPIPDGPASLGLPALSDEAT